MSGPFAMHVVASSARYKKVYLVGFGDVRGAHFYSSEPNTACPSQGKAYLTGALSQIYEYPEIDWRVWVPGATYEENYGWFPAQRIFEGRVAAIEGGLVQ
jgi:hypothetical protein